MEVTDIIRGHYGGAGLDGSILSALHDAGVDTDALTVSDLAPVDQLHAGGLAATTYLLEHLQLGPGTRLLDVGCGIGGPARFAAAQYGCPVVGVDLSPDFVRVAQVITARVGLSSLVEHRVAAGDALDFDNGSFDAAMMVHVGMNIPDKAAVFADVRRVLRSGAVFALFEQMLTGDGAVPYPLPWATDERSSFVASPARYAEQLTASGFVVETTENRTASSAGPVGGQQRLSPAAVFGPAFVERIANNVAATRAEVLQPVMMLARAV